MAEKNIRTGEELIQYIRELIFRRNIPIGELEKKAGIATGYISRITKEKISPNVSLVLNILNALEIDILLVDESSNDDKVYSILKTKCLEEDSTLTDRKLLYLISTIVKKKDLTVSDKKRICKILEAFL